MGPVIVYFDGICEAARPGGRRNPGGLAWGGYYIPARSDVPGLEADIRDGAFFVEGDEATNNVAEYLAAHLVLMRLAEIGYSGPVVLRGDSQLVIRQFNGEWAVNKPNLAKLCNGLRDRARAFSSFKAEWVPRDQNEEADAASRQAYEEAKQQRSA